MSRGRTNVLVAGGGVAAHRIALVSLEAAGRLDSSVSQLTRRTIAGGGAAVAWAGGMASIETHRTQEGGASCAALHRLAGTTVP